MYTEICKSVEKIIKKYDERNPKLLCRYLGVKLLYQSLGNEPDSIKGFYLESKRIKTITINSDLPANIKRIIIAHELGHAVLHKNYSFDAFCGINLFQITTSMEREANLFSAELLIDDDFILETQSCEYTFFSIAANLKMPIELLDYKFRIMKWKGHKLIDPPISADNCFLRDIKLSNNVVLNK